MGTTNPLEQAVSHGKTFSENDQSGSLSRTERNASILEKGAEITGGVAAIQAMEPKSKLPGQKLPYYLHNGGGERYLVGGLVVNLIARHSLYNMVQKIP